MARIVVCGFIAVAVAMTNTAAVADGAAPLGILDKILKKVDALSLYYVPTGQYRRDASQSLERKPGRDFYGYGVRAMFGLAGTPPWQLDLGVAYGTLNGLRARGPNFVAQGSVWDLPCVGLFGSWEPYVKHWPFRGGLYLGIGGGVSQLHDMRLYTFSGDSTKMVRNVDSSTFQINATGGAMLDIHDSIKLIAQYSNVYRAFDSLGYSPSLDGHLKGIPVGAPQSLAFGGSEISLGIQFKIPKTKDSSTAAKR